MPELLVMSAIGTERTGQPQKYDVRCERRSDVVAYTELTDFSLCMGVADLNAKGDNEIFLMPTSWGS